MAKCQGLIKSGARCSRAETHGWKALIADQVPGFCFQHREQSGANGSHPTPTAGVGEAVPMEVDDPPVNIEVLSTQIWACKTIEKTSTLLRLQPFSTQTGKALTWGEVLHLWRSDNNKAFAVWFTQQLAAAPFKAFFWETPPVALSTLGHPFEMALTKCTFTKWAPEKYNFFSVGSSAVLLQNRAGIDEVVNFPSMNPTSGQLSTHTTLVVPSKNDEDSVYIHLANFVRAPARQEQQCKLWRELATVVQQCVEAEPHRERYVSTEGTGIHWLHLRVAKHPAHFNHEPYTLSRLAPVAVATNNTDAISAMAPGGTAAACRFRDKCNRADCWYTHPDGFAPPKSAERRPLCRFGDACTRPDCFFQHDPTAGKPLV
mmetsp:Transcript_5751/g.9959  ORF Transcript_5751/g.9959 Transcript_5751/m.9959 type:complete len:373 (+) Transcript_5751:265-1383(+)